MGAQNDREELLPLQGFEQVSQEPLFPGELSTLPYLEIAAHIGSLPFGGEEGLAWGKQASS